VKRVKFRVNSTHLEISDFISFFLHYNIVVRNENGNH